jgi:hypothetical protein
MKPARKTKAMFSILPNSYLDGNKIELTIVEIIEIDGL